MNLQRRLLHAMLGLLVLAAAAGVSTIFLPGGEFLARVAGTLVMAAVAMALAIPVSRRLGVQADRTRGMIGLLADVAGFCLGLAALWSEEVLGRYSLEFFFTTIAYVVTVVPALWFLVLFGRPGGRPAGAAGIAGCGAVFAGWVAAVWFDRLGVGLGDKCGETAGLFAAATLPMAACLYGAGRPWRYAGALAGLIGIGSGLTGIWIAPGGEPTLVIDCIIAAAVVGGVNVLGRLGLPPRQAWLRLATSGMLTITGVLGIAVSWMAREIGSFQFDDLLPRLMTASAIVTCCGVLAIIVLMAFNRRFVVTEARSLSAIRSMKVHCPRCSLVQEAALGESSCAGCRLTFLIRVAEPRCAKCGYALLDIRGDRCPECGEPIGSGQASTSSTTSPAM